MPFESCSENCDAIEPGRQDDDVRYYKPVMASESLSSLANVYQMKQGADVVGSYREWNQKRMQEM